MDIRVYADYREMSQAAAQIVAEQIRSKSDSVLGLATGSTPEGMYAELVAMFRQGKVDFSQARSFNLDEYVGMDPEDPRSYHAFMRKNLFAHVNFAPGRTHVPSGLGSDLDEQAREYERMIAAAGGVDLQVLGIGMNGHIGFNEPGSSFDSRTRVVDLTEQTVSVNREKTEAQSLPAQAVSMGMGTIAESRRVLLLASGEGKAEIIARAVKGPVTPDVPASALQRHPSVIVVLDAAAASRIDG